MTLPKRPHWVDQLFEKHECFGYDEPATVEVQHAGRTVQVLVPSYLTDVQSLVTAESGPLLFVLGKQSQKYRDAHLGVLLVAKHREGDTYEVGVWHELFPWALKHLELAKPDGAG